VPARGKFIVPPALAVALPEGCYGRIAPRSGLAWKSHIDVAAGVVDRDYRGAGFLVPTPASLFSPARALPLARVGVGGGGRWR